MNTFRLFLLSPLGGLVLRWTVLLMFAWTANAVMCQSHPRRRLILWRGVLVLGCLLPFGVVIPIKVFRIDGDPALARGLALTNSSAPSAVGIRPQAIVRAGPAFPVKSSPMLLAAEGLLSYKSGATLVALVWIVGGAAGAIRLLLLQLRLSRLRRNASEPDSELLVLARDVQARLGVRQTVAVRVSDEVTSPFVCGLLHPTIILPAQLLRSLGPAQIPALLSHEMAHLRSHDLAWCVGWRWMKTLCWFHPLVWNAPAAHNLACEQEADRIASGQWADRSLYTRLLAQLTLRAMELPAVETTLALNGASQIVKRLALLQRDGFRSWKLRDSLTGFGLVVGLAFVTAGWGFSNARAEGSPDGGLKEHTKRSTPDPDREPLLRRNIAGLISGQPDLDDMDAGLIAATNQQWPRIQVDFGGIGALKSLVFKKVDDHGGDIYVATFENKKWEFLVGPLNADHKMQGLLMLPAPDAATIKRIESNAPDPDREQLLRRFIAGLISGQPDLDDMGPRLIAATYEQWTGIQKTFGGAGALKSLEFKNVDESGYDVYVGKFETKNIEFLIGPLNSGHKMEGLFLRPAP